MGLNQDGICKLHFHSSFPYTETQQTIADCADSDPILYGLDTILTSYYPLTAAQNQTPRLLQHIAAYILYSPKLRICPLFEFAFFSVGGPVVFIHTATKADNHMPGIAIS